MVEQLSTSVVLWVGNQYGSRYAMLYGQRVDLGNHYAANHTSNLSGINWDGLGHLL